MGTWAHRVQSEIFGIEQSHIGMFAVSLFTAACTAHTPL